MRNTYSRKIVVIILLLSLSACPQYAVRYQSPDTSEASAELEKLLEEIWQWKLRNYPEFATKIGDSRYNDKWTDLSITAITQRKADERDFLARFKSINVKQLSRQNRLTQSLIEKDLQLAVDYQKFDYSYLAINQMGGIQQDAPFTLTVSPRNNSLDYANLLTRLKSLPTQIRQTINLLKLGLTKGITPPKITLRNIPDQISGLLKDKVEESPLFTAFTNISTEIDNAEIIQQQARQAIETEVYPAYRELRNFIENEYIPNARIKIGLSELPGGKKWYELAIRANTTTQLSAEQIHNIGKAEVARIYKEMQALAGKSGFKGSYQSYIKYLNSDSQFYFDTGDALVSYYRDLCKQADAKMPNLFSVLPRLPYGVQPVPEHMQQSSALAYYEPGSIDAARAGVFYANTYALDSRPIWEMAAIALHETVPGHHLQIAIAQELENIHPLRKYQFWTAYVEGWALYAEKLGTEIDLYPDTNSNYGRLAMEMWRAIRLVVDTGIHAKGWTRQQAINYFKKYSPKKEVDIIIEVDRYIVWPGQALAYKIGEMKILELREYASKALGTKFDLRAFHDQLLANGALPLDILEQEVKTWVKSI